MIQIMRRRRRWTWLLAAHPQRSTLEVGAHGWLVFDDDVPRWQLWRTLGGDLTLHLLVVHISVCVSRRVDVGATA